MFVEARGCESGEDSEKQAPIGHRGPSAPPHHYALRLKSPDADQSNLMASQELFCPPTPNSNSACHNMN